MISNCVLLKKNQIYWPLSFTGKLSSDFGLLSKMKSNLEDLYLNIKQCILILLKKYTIRSHNLVLLLLKKRTLFRKIPAVSVHESKRVSCCSQLWKRLQFGRAHFCAQLFCSSYKTLSVMQKVSCQTDRKAEGRTNRMLNTGVYFRANDLNFSIFLCCRKKGR